jgi:hypothetical protein
MKIGSFASHYCHSTPHNEQLAGSWHGFKQAAIVKSGDRIISEGCCR